MPEFMWHWTQDNKKIYTLQIERAEQAMKKGFLVMGVRVNSV
ncbi:MAG: hypothetical protein QXL17_07460 [Candidatus Thermoplasmatota archaeon]